MAAYTIKAWYALPALYLLRYQGYMNNMFCYYSSAYHQFNLPSKEIESICISSVGSELGIIVIFSI